MNRNQHSGLWPGILLVATVLGVAASGTGMVAPGPGAPSLAAVAFAAQQDAETTPAPISTLTSLRTTTPAAVATATRLSATTPLSPTPIAAPSSVSTVPPAATGSAGQVIGYSTLGRAIVAHRIGEGAIKVALVGDIHGEPEANTYRLAEQLLEYFQGHPADVPTNISLWIIPSLNPDGLATGHRWNANDVDLNRNADTDLDGCGSNDWSRDTVGNEGQHPGAGGGFPFSEPETRAARDFLSDAWLAVFYHSAAEAIFVDACRQHAPTARLAEVLSEATDYPVPAEGWTGYPITGDFGDYLAGEGVAAVSVELTDHDDPEFERNLAGVKALLEAADEIVSAEATAAEADYVWLDESNTGTWHYANSFVHPIALEIVNGRAYLLDGGRVLTLDLEEPTPPQVLLVPGDYVEDVRVLEPLDLASVEDALLALDRAGDVYRYDPQTDAWGVELYGRAARDASDHYYVALAGGEEAGYLLETTHEQVWRFVASSSGAGSLESDAWIKLSQSRDVDLAAHGRQLYALTRAMNTPRGTLLQFEAGRPTAAFQPNITLMHPRQLVATDRAVLVLDRAGRRLLALDPETGALLSLYQFSDRRAVSAVWRDPSGQRLIMAGRDAIYFYGEPRRHAAIEDGMPLQNARTPMLEGAQPHDPALLESLRGLSMPLEGAHLTSRDFQMPGAPRHYRLGVHEGIDFYSQTVGIPVNRSTLVRAVADGFVIRALVDYQSLTSAQADAWDARCRSLGYTPPEVLDSYRGMQIWIDHGNGLVSRYAHLSGIQAGIKEGTRVTKGQVIATVGNSGTPASIHSQTTEVHLHLELWVGDHFVGQSLRPVEAREWLEKILR